VKKRKAAGGRAPGENLQGQRGAPFALITNTLAKDKEISDRWRGFPGRRGHSRQPNPRQPRVRAARSSMRWSVRSRAAYPRFVAIAITRLRARLVSKKKKLAHWGSQMRRLPFCPPPAGSPWPRCPKHGTDGLPRDFSAREMAQHLPNDFFTDRWIDAPVRPRQGGPGAIPSQPDPRRRQHPYVLMNYQGKPRERDDACPRTRPRRASGAGRPKNGALMAPTRPLTAWRRPASVFGEMLTFKAAVWRRPPSAQAAPGAALPARSRTCSTRWCGRSRFYTFERAVHIERRQWRT